MDLIAQNGSLIALAVAGGGLLAFVGVMSQLGGKYNLDHVKSKTTGDGQYGTARCERVKRRRSGSIFDSLSS